MTFATLLPWQSRAAIPTPLQRFVCNAGFIKPEVGLRDSGFFSAGSGDYADPRQAQMEISQ